MLCYTLSMVTLLQSNPYLRVKAAVRRNIRYNARQSCFFEGVRVSAQMERARANARTKKSSSSR